ncbi:MAG: CHAD domain-containing protein [Phycisphaerales bacterium]|nr:CHAD domain-containing protein [Phycisphaerales bacterium]
MADLLEAIEKVKRRSNPTSAAVHRLRVCARRALAITDLLADANDRRLIKAAAAVNTLRTAAGRVRNAHVMSQALSKLTVAKTLEPAIEHLRARLRSHERSGLRRLAKRLPDAHNDVQQFDRRVRKALATNSLSEAPAVWREGLASLIKAAQALGENESTVNAAKRPASKATRKAPSAADLLASVERLHELRVALKRVRYAAELCEPGLSSKELREVLSELTNLQQALGQLNDACVLLKLAQRRLSKAKTSKVNLRTSLSAFITREQKLIRSSAADARSSWNTAGRAALRKLLDAVSHHERTLALASPSPSSSSPSFHPLPIEDQPTATPALDQSAIDPTKPQRIAAIDIGTNSIRLIVAEASPNGRYRVLDDEKEIVRLGKGLDSTGKLDDNAMAHGCATIANMARIARGYNARVIRAVATSAVREATNGRDFQKRAQQLAGLPIDVITAQEEAALCFRSVSAAFDLSAMTVATIDIGGGSTEIVTASGGLVEQVDLLPIGAVKLTERFGGPEAAAGARFDELRKFLDKFIASKLKPAPVRPQLIIGTGGTFTSLAAMAIQRAARKRDEKAPPAPIGALRGYEVKLDELSSIIRELRKLPLDQRARYPGLAADRADIIVPGLTILHRLCKALKVKRLRVHDGGIRDGVLLEISAKIFPSAPNLQHANTAGRAGAIINSVRRFAESCRYDAAHAAHAAKLALSIFDQLASAISAGTLRVRSLSQANATEIFSSDSRLLLYASALLLDIGYVVNYDKHHVHSANLILHADMPGLTSEQTRLIALVARFHRGAAPRKRHPLLRDLTKHQRAVVRVLSSIVRVAVGLDRSHTQSINAVRLVPSADQLRVLVDCEPGTDPAVDLWGAQRKSVVFSSILKLPVTFIQAAAQAPLHPHAPAANPEPKPAIVITKSPKLNGRHTPPVPHTAIEAKPAR